LIESRQGEPGECQIDQNQAITSLVFSNRLHRQTLFYQLTLHQDGRRAEGPFWWAAGKTGVGGWASTKGEARFGFQDRLDKFGLREPEIGDRLDLDVDLLTRIRQVITEGRKYGMDQDLSHWFFSGVYIGQSLWGHGSLATSWTSYELDVKFED